MWKALAGVAVAALICGSVMAAEEKGLVARWTFNEADGSIAKDVTGNGNDGAITGGQFAKRGDGFALKLDGKTTMVDCGSKPGLALEKTVTVSLWAFPMEVPAGAGNEPALATQGDLCYGLTFYVDGCCWTYIGGGGNSISAPLAILGWHHLVETYDGANIKLYIDGAVVASKAYNGPIPTGGNFIMGKRGDFYFKGMLADVRVYNRGLSADEIAALYKAGSAIK